MPFRIQYVTLYDVLLLGRRGFSLDGPCFVRAVSVPWVRVVFWIFYTVVCTYVRFNCIVPWVEMLWLELDELAAIVRNALYEFVLEYGRCNVL